MGDPREEDQSEYKKKQDEFKKELDDIKAKQDDEGKKVVGRIEKHAENIFEQNKPSPGSSDDTKETKKVEEDLKAMLEEEKKEETLKKKKKGKGEEKEEEKAEDKQPESIVDAIVEALKKIFGPKKGEKKDDKDVGLEALKEKSGSIEKSEKSEESEESEKKSFKNVTIYPANADNMQKEEGAEVLKSNNDFRSYSDKDNPDKDNPEKGFEDIKKLFDDFKSNDPNKDQEHQEKYTFAVAKDATKTAIQIGFPEAAIAEKFVGEANKKGLTNEVPDNELKSTSSLPTLTPPGTKN